MPEVPEPVELAVADPQEADPVLGPHISTSRPPVLVSGITARQHVLPLYRAGAPGNSSARTVLRTPSAATTRSDLRRARKLLTASPAG